MLPFAINHMSAPRLAWDDLLTLAADLNCVGVEFRNDLERPLFDGADPSDVAQRARSKGLRIVGLSQVYPFNAWSDEIHTAVRDLITMAQACGAETISLIPRNDGEGRGNGERQAQLRLALREIRPLLEEAGMVALVEPLGFVRSSLRSKAETIDAIEAVGGAQQFRIVHDTFHHFLAGGGEIFPEHTGLVHVSGVVDQTVPVDEMEDAHRIMVDAHDRLGNIEQIAALREAGFRGPISMEAFSPLVHADPDPARALGTSFEFIRSSLSATAA